MEILLGMILLGLYGMIRMYDKVDFGSFLVFPQLACNCCMISFLILWPSSYYNKISEAYITKVTTSWPVRGGNFEPKSFKRDRKEGKSLQDFGIGIGMYKIIKFYHIEIFYFSVTNYIVTILCAFEGYWHWPATIGEFARKRIPPQCFLHDKHKYIHASTSG